MNKSITLSALFSLLNLFCFAQTDISGIINSYGEVTNISTGICAPPVFTLDDASGFVAGESILIIQMQGAEIDETNTTSFGDVVNQNGAGLYEKNEIRSISGNDITLEFELVNFYDVNGSVQVVNIKEYVDANVTGALTAAPWNGAKGGVLALGVSGTLTQSADITVNGTGFRGGTTEFSSYDCQWFNPDAANGFHYANANLGAAKGEGITKYVLGKEYGRGKQSNGGGGGNDHNAGGGGGGHAGVGGIGSEYEEASTFRCEGRYPGLGGVSIPSLTNRLLMGGGGGAGHQNNNVGTNGGNGGGIIYMKVNVLNPNWNFIMANGLGVVETLGPDGASGGGAGGTIYADIGSLGSGGAKVQSTGGNGGNMNLNGQDRCMGPGGGGGGGVIYANLGAYAGSTYFGQVTGGNPGTITNGTEPCVGTPGTAQAGANGLETTTLPLFIEATIVAPSGGGGTGLDFVR